MAILIFLFPESQKKGKKMEKVLSWDSDRCVSRDDFENDRKRIVDLAGPSPVDAFVSLDLKSIQLAQVTFGADVLPLRKVYRLSFFLYHPSKCEWRKFALSVEWNKKTPDFTHFKRAILKKYDEFLSE